MLILTNSNCLWINFCQFCQRILYSMSNTNSPSNRHIQVWIFILCQLRSWIYWCSSLWSDHILHFEIIFFDKISNNLFRFPTSSSIPNYDQINTILFYQVQKRFFCFCNFILRFCWINYFFSKKFSCLIYNSQFTSCSKSRIKSQNCQSLYRRRQKQIFQIISKNSNCRFICPSFLIWSKLSLNWWQKKPCQSILYRLIQIFYTCVNLLRDKKTSWKFWNLWLRKLNSYG